MSLLFCKSQRIKKKNNTRNLNSNANENKKKLNNLHIDILNFEEKRIVLLKNGYNKSMFLILMN